MRASTYKILGPVFSVGSRLFWGDFLFRFFEPFGFICFIKKARNCTVCGWRRFGISRIRKTISATVGAFARGVYGVELKCSMFGELNW